MEIISHTNFTINTEFLCDVPVTTQMFFQTDVFHPETGELVIKKGKGHSTLGHKDHPEFTKLREHLGDAGFISIETSWWNGDRVTKPFALNEHEFEVGDQFSCAAAIKHTLGPLA